MSGWIKICGLKTAGDLVACHDAGADAVGWNFCETSRRFLTPDAAHAAISEAGLGTQCPENTGVFVNAGSEAIGHAVRQAGLQRVQLHGDETSEFMEALRQQLPGVRWLRAQRLGFPLSAAVEQTLSWLNNASWDVHVLVDAFVPGEYGGTGKQLHPEAFQAARRLVSRKPLILAGGLTPDNVGDAIRALRPDGVDVAGGVEDKSGAKDHAKIGQFIREARAAFADLL